jgi:hypothetical protein
MDGAAPSPEHCSDLSTARDSLDHPLQLEGSVLAAGGSGLELADDLLGCVAGAFHGRVIGPAEPGEDGN